MTDAGQGPTEDVPIFPLRGVVLLPSQLLPLHVFEPRYRALVAHCLEHDAPLGMATLVHDASDTGASELHPELGVGRIVRHQPLPDGRSNILVASTGCATIVQDVATHDPFRWVRVRPLPPPSPVSADAEAGLRTLLDQVLRSAGPLGAREQWLQQEGDAFVDAVAHVFVRDADSRRSVLGARDGDARVGVVEQAIAAWLAERPGAFEA